MASHITPRTGLEIEVWNSFSHALHIRLTQHSLLPNRSQIQRSINIVQRVTLSQDQISSETCFDLSAV